MLRDGNGSGPQCLNKHFETRAGVSGLAPRSPFLQGGEQSPEDDRVFSQRAISLFKALIPVLVAMRDSGERALTIESLRSALSFDEFLALGKRASEGKIPEKVAASMSAFMASLGIFPDRSPFLEKAKEQFHYISVLANRAIDLGAAPPLVGNIHAL